MNSPIGKSLSSLPFVRRPSNSSYGVPSAIASPALRGSLKDAKARLDVRALWSRLGLPGEPGLSVRCPFHDDHSASFSVYDGVSGEARWKCHARCGGGGPIELIARALDISERDACRQLLALVNGEHINTPVAAPRARPKPAVEVSHRLILPDGLHHGSREELVTVATKRGLPLDALMLAEQRGLLWFAEPRCISAWIVTDKARINAQARRMDGGLWRHIGNRKAYTLPKSRAAWPIGTQEAQRFPFVILVEGGPDLLAAHHFIVAEGREADTAAVAMLGAANSIPEDALLFLAHKHVRLFPHHDPIGQAAAVRWTEQLERVGCEVDAFSFDGLWRSDGQAVKDLNDLALLDADCFEAEREELSKVLPP